MFGNYIDLIVIFYVLVYAIAGIRKNIPNLVASLLSLLIALFLAFSTYKFSADFFENNFQIKDAYASAIGFFLNIFIFKLIVIVLLDKLFQKNAKIFKIENVSLKNILGTTVAALYGMLIVFIMFSSFISLSLPTFINKKIGNSEFGRLIQDDTFGMNNNFKDIFGGILKAALQDFSFMNIETGPDETVDLGFKALEVSINSEAEEQMLEMVNQERVSRGLKALEINEEARRAARDYGEYLFKNGIFSHTDLEGNSPGDRIKEYDVEFMMTGENLAYASNLKEAHEGLMNSKGHRENILHPFFGRVGIGVIDGGEEYGMIFVQEFLD
ncbi:MAG: CvpA family protein [Candidatus Paceibacterota bacterium]